MLNTENEAKKMAYIAYANIFNGICAINWNYSDDFYRYVIVNEFIVPWIYIRS